MSWLEHIIVTVLVLSAVVYMLRRSVRMWKQKSASGCGCGTTACKVKQLKPTGSETRRVKV